MCRTEILTCANYFRNLSFRLANTFVCLVHHANVGNIQYIYDQIFWSAVGVSAPVGGVNRGYTLTSTVDGAGDALGLRRTYGPLTGFQPNEFREYKVTFSPWMSQKYLRINGAIWTNQFSIRNRELKFVQLSLIVSLCKADSEYSIELEAWK